MGKVSKRAKEQRGARVCRALHDTKTFEEGKHLQGYLAVELLHGPVNLKHGHTVLPVDLVTRRVLWSSGLSHDGITLTRRTHKRE